MHYYTGIELQLQSYNTQWNEKALEGSTGFLALVDCIMGCLYCY